MKIVNKYNAESFLNNKKVSFQKKKIQAVVNFKTKKICFSNPIFSEGFEIYQINNGGGEIIYSQKWLTIVPKH